MKALAATHFGAFDQVLSLREISDAATSVLLQPNEVLVRVAWSEVNPVDLQKLQGGKRSGEPVGTGDDGEAKTFVPGFAGSGVVVRQGLPAEKKKQDNDDKSDEESQGVMLLPCWDEGRPVAFMVNPSQQPGSYAEYCIVDCRAMAAIPPLATPSLDAPSSVVGISLRQAASVPLAGCTAYESLLKLQLGPATSSDSTKRTNKKTLLIVGGAGGVGSWATLLARAWHDADSLEIIVTTNSHAEWCIQQGASRCLRHDEIASSLAGGVQGSVDAILCLTEPTPTLFQTLSEVIRPYGHLCLVVAGASIQQLDCGFLFFKSVHLSFETVFSCFRTNFSSKCCPGEEIATILHLVSSQRIPGVPLSPLLLNEAAVDEDWKQATTKGGILDKLQGGHVAGKLVMRVGGDSVITTTESKK